MQTTFHRFYAEYLEDHIADKAPSLQGHIPIRCPLPDHNDTSPSAYIDVNTGRLFCPVCNSSPGFTHIEFLKLTKFLTEEEAEEEWERFRQANNLIEYDIEADKEITRAVPRGNRRFEALRIKAQESIDPEIPMVKRYMASRGLRFETLKECGVGFLHANETTKRWNKDSIVFPYTFGGQTIGIRYRDKDANKNGEDGSSCPLWNVDDLVHEPYEGMPEVAIVCEGESDRLCAYQALQRLPIRVSVVCMTTASYTEDKNKFFQYYRKVIFIPQIDGPSRKMKEKAREALGQKFGCVDLEFGVLQVGKDLCDWMKYTSETKFCALVMAAIGNLQQRFYEWTEFEKAADEEGTGWLIEGLLATQQIAVVSGGPKAKKTWFALNLARTILCPGEDFCGISGLTGVAENAKVMIVEEEGNKSEFKSRMKKTLSGIDLKHRVFIGHQVGLKIDDWSWISILERQIEANGADVLILDPMQRLHSKDENSASEMAPFWDHLHYLIQRFPHLTVILLHHNNKMGNIEAGFGGQRGSIRTGTECDLGCFIEAKPGKKYIKVGFVGRMIDTITDSNGHEELKLDFDGDTGRFTVNEKPESIEDKIRDSKKPTKMEERLQMLLIRMRDLGGKMTIQEMDYFGWSVDIARTVYKMAEAQGLIKNAGKHPETGSRIYEVVA